MEFVIKNGTVVNSICSYKADIEVSNGRIVSIGSNLDTRGKEVIDATDLLVLPGAIDLHTHMSDPFGGTVSSDDEVSGSMAAACGGVTTMFDFATQAKGMHLMEAIETKKKNYENNACIDYSVHCIITDLLENDEVLTEMQEVVNCGVNSFKCYCVYRKEGLMIDEFQFPKILATAAKVGGITTLHAENAGLVEFLTEKYIKEGKTTPWYHYLSRPEYVAAEADVWAINLAKNLNAPLYIVHMDNKEGLEAASKAKRDGAKIYIETCPHYLEFNSDVYKGIDAVKFVCSPPIKGEQSRLALWNGVKNGDIDTIATDHCPFNLEEKNWGNNDFTKIPNGCGGIENRYPYMLSAATNKKISYNKVVDVCCERPAKIFGCVTKGYLLPGMDADIVLYDPKLNVTANKETTHTKCDHSIWDGFIYSGYPVQTYLRGKLIYDHGKYVGNIEDGKFIKRQPLT